MARWSGLRWPSRPILSRRRGCRCSTVTNGELSTRTSGFGAAAGIRGCRAAKASAMSAQAQSAVPGKASAGKLAILYDGSCDMCRASVDGINQFDNSGLIEPFDLNDQDVRAKFPDLKLEKLLEELHAADDHGRVYRGASARSEILRRLRGLTGHLAYP